MSDWIDGTAAVLEAWLPGESGGAAIADIVFGDVNPSGKLPETFPLRLQDTPSYLNHPGEGDTVRYGEGIFVGYRAYDALERPVLFPFGHGLSYTQFVYGEPRLSRRTISSDETISVSVDVTNVGGCTGKEIVQVYVSDRVCSLPRPPKELKGFAKVELGPGETRRVAVDLSFRSFAFYHPGHGRWVVEGGDFDVLVGSSSADIRGTCNVTVRKMSPLPPLLSGMSSLGDWLADATGRKVLEPRMPAIVEALIARLGHATDNPRMLESAVWDWVQTVPLTYVLDVGAEQDSTPPVDVVAHLLAEVRRRTLDQPTDTEGGAA